MKTMLASYGHNEHIDGLLLGVVDFLCNLTLATAENEWDGHGGHREEVQPFSLTHLTAPSSFFPCVLQSLTSRKIIDPWDAHSSQKLINIEAQEAICIVCVRMVKTALALAA